MTFVATLAFAPHIQTGILAGITFSLGAFIYRRMLPRISVYALGDDGALREMLSGQPPRAGGEQVVALRYDAALFFANASFFEDAVNRLKLENPQLQAIVVLAQGINLVDATAIEVLRALHRQLAEQHIRLIFSQPQRHFVAAATRTGLLEALGPQALFDSPERALAAVCQGFKAGPGYGTLTPPVAGPIPPGLNKETRR